MASELVETQRLLISMLREKLISSERSNDYKEERIAKLEKEYMRFIHDVAYVVLGTRKKQISEFPTIASIEVIRAIENKCQGCNK